MPLQEIVTCEECGETGPLDEIGTCGEWLGTPDKGYACPDIICFGCRNDEYEDNDED